MKTILIADKDAIARELVSLAFPDQMDYRVVGASTGSAAILKSKEIKPDIVIADVFLSDKNGYEVSREIKGEPTLEGTPVILLISSLGVFDEVRAAESYADDFIIKPFSSEEITKKVESLIARHEREKVEPAFNSLFGGVFKTEGDLEFEEFNESISRSRDSLGHKSLEIIFQTIAKNLESGCEIAKESGRGLKRKVARLGELITLYEIPKVAAYLKAPLFIRRGNLILLLGLAIVLPIIILAIFTHEREVKLTGENIQNQEKKEAQAQEVPLQTGMRVSSRQRIRNTSKLRIRERRKHRTKSQRVVAYERKKELEKQLRATLLLGD